MEALVGLLVLCGAAGILVFIYKRLLYICGPNEVLIFSGRQQVVNGKKTGYVAIKGGRGLKLPLLEVVDRMDLTNMAISVSIKGAFSKGGIPLNVDGVANIKIAGQEPALSNAVEKLLGKKRSEIRSIAKETLEGNLRGVLATMTPEEVNSDKMRFAKELMEEADHDLSKLGIELDTLNIQNISDDRGYLDSIGRISSATVRKDALIAEAENQAASATRVAKNDEEAQLVSIDARLRTLEAETQRKIAFAESNQGVMVAQAKGEIAAMVTEARAQLEVQKARVEQVKQRLEADVIAPAEAKATAAIQKAQGDAYRLLEDGRAMAQMLKEVTAAWNEAGEHARDVFLMQKLSNIIQSVSEVINDVSIDRVTVLGTNGVSTGHANLAQSIVSTNEQLKAAVGLDVLSVVSEKLQLPETTEDVQDCSDEEE